MGDLTLFELLASGAFDHLNCQNTGNLTKFFQKSQMPRGLPEGVGGRAVLQLTNTSRDAVAFFRSLQGCH